MRRHATKTEDRARQHPEANIECRLMFRDEELWAANHYDGQQLEAAITWRMWMAPQQDGTHERCEQMIQALEEVSSPIYLERYEFRIECRIVYPWVVSSA